MWATQGYLNQSGTKSRLAKEDLAVTNSKGGASRQNLAFKILTTAHLIGQTKGLTLYCLFFIPGGS